MPIEEPIDLLAELSSYENLVHAISGLCGGVSAISAFYPLNAVRRCATRLPLPPHHH